MTSAAILHVCSTSLEAGQQAGGLNGWQQDYEQLSAGAFEGWIESASLGPLQLFRERANQKLLQVGRPRAGTLAVGLVDPGAGPTGWFCGQAVAAARVIAIGPDQGFELVAPAGMGLAGIAVDLAEIGRLGRQLHGNDFALGPPGPAVLQRPAACTAELARLLDAVLALAARPGAVLRQPATLGAVVESVGTAVLDALLPEPLTRPVRVSAAAHRRILRQAREYMRAHVDEPVSVPALCEATAASRRNLQYVFGEVLGIGPVAYLRVMRLNRVRRDLLREPAVAIGDIAARWGFWHLPRFAADYRRFFGELPSATRGRARQGG